MKEFSWRRRWPLDRAETVLFLVVFACSAFFSEIAYQTSNYTARLFLTRAVVDYGTFRLDAYSEAELGLDVAVYNGHVYSNKPPGSSLLMLPQYLLIGKPVQLLLRALDLPIQAQNQKFDLVNVFTGWLVQIFSLAFYSAVAFVALYRILGLLGLTRRRFALTLLSYFGTLMFPYATIGTGEMYTVPPLLLGLYFLLKTTRMKTSEVSETSEVQAMKSPTSGVFYAGLFYALAIFTTNQVALMAAIALAYLCWQRRAWRPLLPALAAFSLPLFLAGLLTLLYNWAIFDHPLRFPIQYWEQGQAEVILFEWPTAAKVVEMLFLPWKGLFFYSPYLLLSVPGFARLNRQRPGGPAVVFLLAGSFLAFFLFLLFNVGWFGGADFGFRYVVPALPFLCLGAAAWLDRPRLYLLDLVLTAASVAICTFGALTDPEVPTGIRNPLLTYNLPIFLEQATNNVPNLVAEQLLGLNNWLMRLATSAFFLAALGWLVWRFQANVSRVKYQVSGDVNPVTPDT
ncbi:MAG: hypothetical protein L0332_02340 [Chloroflexi bacterium]|nr:hypothetical protein [Chloroflexota bacterium]MCI0577521.1 hypothetical protein [Chloroflexota bacterium]MCI0645640.1 hypothetical protein [Chloroflexota bacterium]MCI0725552.1 hypothetical protein [Chloroflexota bacterium]